MTSTDSRQLVIVGAGGLGHEVLWAAQATDWQPIGFLDDSPNLTALDAPYLGPISRANKYRDAHFVIAIGDPRIRRTIARHMIGANRLRFATVIHPSAILSPSVDVGVGTVISASCIATVHIKIGSHVILDRGVNVGHNCRIGDFCTVSPLTPLAGNVALEDGVWIGASAAIRQGLTLERGSMVGMGSVVVRDVKANELVVGSPAKTLKTLPIWE